jgi:nicotinate-nucleotide pyrophosphorylase (carboxylating)
MSKEFHQLDWDDQLADDCRQIVRLAVREDLDRWHDWTTVALVPAGAQGSATIVARQAGVVAGLPAARLALEEMDRRVQLSPLVRDGDRIAAGQTIARLDGPARSLLTAERLLLNLLSRLSGVATLARAYVDAVAGTHARVYDTRKTTPGWRRLEKYAVRQGGGCNHRTGLFDAVLIKDNHLALGAACGPTTTFSPAEAVHRARQFLAEMTTGDPRPADSRPGALTDVLADLIVEIEVDTLEQLDAVLPAGPDMVLLDNMSLADIAEAVRRRSAVAPLVELEASGGVRLDTIAAIAATGVDRISVGALTHSAAHLDLGLDWQR